MRKRQRATYDIATKDQDVKYKTKESEVDTNYERCNTVTKENDLKKKVRFMADPEVGEAEFSQNLAQVTGDEEAPENECKVVTNETGDDMATKHQEVKASENKVTKTGCPECGRRPALAGRVLCGPCYQAIFDEG